ncbi:hypothetical protein V493_07332 [Pseudogymnoascus sp. VKM F-4281 (FW-2241)]|nr:hypothetical protein V493_07332 [Pseudogymnoascus sp. VKM F-4281 (FW-2241)]
MLPRMLGARGRAVLAPLRARIAPNGGARVVQRRGLVSPPKVGGAPLMERRADRELPEIQRSGMKWLRSIPIFIAVLTGCTLGIFNYQKSSSSVVSSTMYALRTSPAAREFLGDEIYFAHQMPWIWGEMNQLHGRIDIHFEVRGTKRQGTMRFRSFRRGGRNGVFETEEWSLEGDDGVRVDLLDRGDVFKAIMKAEEEQKKVGRGSYSPTLSG